MSVYRGGSINGGTTKSSNFIGFSIINPPAIGVTPIYGPPRIHMVPVYTFRSWTWGSSMPQTPLDPVRRCGRCSTAMFDELPEVNTVPVPFNLHIHVFKPITSRVCLMTLNIWCMYYLCQVLVASRTDELMSEKNAWHIARSTLKRVRSSSLCSVRMHAHTYIYIYIYTCTYRYRY